MTSVLTAPREAFSGPSSAYIRLSEAAIPGSPPVNAWISAVQRSDQRLQLRVGRVRPGEPLGVHLGDQVGPVLLGLGHPLLAERVAARLELLQLLGRVVLLRHLHHLDGVDDLVRRRFADLVERVEDAPQPPAEVASLGQLLLDTRQVGGDRRAQIRALAFEGVADLVQREAKAAQGDDPVEPPHVAVRVAPVAGRRSLGRCEEPDLVPVMQRAHGEAGRLGE